MNNNTMFDIITVGNQIKSEVLDTYPVQDALLRGIAGNFVSLLEILHEIVDNSTANFFQHPNDTSLERTITIEIVHYGSFIDVSVTDGGTGIEDLGAALTIRQNTNGTVLNEHGLGLKHALASVDASANQKWSILTRTKTDAANNRYRQISGPYALSGMTAEVCEGKAAFGEGTGTMVMFRLPSTTMFDTICPKGKRVEPTFEEMVGYIEEDLRMTYAPLLERGAFKIEISACKDNRILRTVDTPLLPKWKSGKRTELPPVDVDLGGGAPVRIHCTYGEIIPSRDNAFYFKGNMSTSGVQIFLNGRLIESNIFEEIWDEKVHNSQNLFLCQVDLEYDDIEAVPPTRSAKNGFRAGDARLEALYRWIKKNVEKPKCDETGPERRLVEALRDKLLREPNVLRATMEETAYEKLGLRTTIDLFVSRSSGEVTIYEAKCGASKAENLFQLMLYWDGCVFDKKPANVAILIAKSHPKQVQMLVQELNRRKDVSGRNYNFELRTWGDEGIKPSV